MIALFSVAITCLLNLLLGTFVFMRNTKIAYLKLFFVMTVFTTLWTLFSYLTNQDYGDSAQLNDIFNRVSFFVGFLAIYTGMWFTYLFPVPRKASKLEIRLILLSGAVVAGLSLTTWIAGTVTLTDKGLNFAIGHLIYVFTAATLGYVLISAYNLSRAVHSGHRAVKSQAVLILFGYTFAVLSALICNVVIPTVTNTIWTTQIGPLITVVFVGSVTYAIVKHRLFDMRGVVARSVAYAVSVVVFATIYGFVVFGLADLLFDFGISMQAELFLSGATGLAALMFPVVRTWFDGFTSHLFYQDEYDSQRLYADLNKVLVSSLDIQHLMSKSIAVIEDALKPGYVAIDLYGEHADRRIFSSKGVSINSETMSDLRHLVPTIKSKVIVTDYMDEFKHVEIGKIMQHNDAAVLVRLTKNVHSSDEGFGYLMLGVKKSGNAYTREDAEVLGTVADELTIAIQNASHYEEIQRLNIALQGRVDDATRKLRRTNESLKALDETKDDFISMASHQLRTPLTSVKGYLSMVLDGDAGDINETQQKMLSQAYTSSQRMVYLIADLLNVSRLKTGKFILESAPTDLAQMIDEELGQLTEAAAARSLTLEYKRPKDFPILMLDETKTRQVLMNFIDNAIYYTPKDGHITIELKDTSSTVEFRVIDNGIGVPKAEHHHLFTKFYRAGNARKARPDGTGLGLFMAKKVITAQKGVLIFDSKEGVGSTFGFTFSKAKLDEAAAQAAKDSNISTHTPVQG